MLTEEQKQTDIRYLAYRVVWQCGIPPALCGFEYLIDAIEMSYNRPELLRGLVTKSLYPEIAKKYNTTAGAVERAIRNAIKNSKSGHNSNAGFIRSAIWFINYGVEEF